MNDTDVLDRAWRDGLAEIAEYGSREGVTQRVEARRHARVVRRRATFTGVVLLVCATAGAGTLGIVESRDANRTVPAGGGTQAPADVVATIHIEVSAAMTLRAVLAHPGDFPPVTYVQNGDTVLPLPRPGIYRFVFSGASGHQETIDGRIAANTGTKAEIVYVTRLAAGRHVLECAVSGHAEAGEKMALLVSP